MAIALNVFMTGTVPAMSTFKTIAAVALRYARVQPDRP